MKRISGFGLLIFSMIFATGLKAQTVDDVINKHIEALGGKEKLLALKSYKMEGNLNTQGYDIAITITKLHNIGSRFDIEVAGTSNYQIITREKGISYMPIQGMSSPTDMPVEAFRAGQNQLDIQSPFLNYKEKESKVELLGSEKIDGEDHYKLKVTFKNGLSTTYFISHKSNMINRTVAKRTINGEETDLETNYGDYKQNADGYWFPYSSTGLQGDTNYDKIETNITVDPSIFK